MKIFKTIKSLLKTAQLTHKKSLSFSSNQTNQIGSTPQLNSYFYTMGKPMWMVRDYNQFANEAYIKNVIAYRAMNMIAQAASSIPLKLFKNAIHPIEQHPILTLLSEPNPYQNKSEFLESIYLYRQISGNAYILTASDLGKLPKEIYSLRPDRVKVIAGENFLPSGYQYQVEKRGQIYPVDQISGVSRILHIKNTSPVSDWYGLSAVEAAAYSIDQHNNAAAWNQALLQNGARPSGAIVVKNTEGQPSELSDEQYSRLKEMVSEDFMGSTNAGKPMILEGGLDWKEISLSPKDMDFIEGKNSAARDIALAFGVPPQLLGIPGDNTYSNLAEARAALWEQTVIPLAENTIDHISKWLTKLCGENYMLKLDKDNIPAIASKRETFWERLEKVSFMTINEKRRQVGFAEIQGGDNIHTK